ncbi:hypothetical protein [Sphingomonas sanguinis]|uniref:hypothetical protein n=1 Tax=Sphingomonas sanguinis TaxID=33051 RepID=UPI00187C469A|nr:hypothetical protein [Sphingomonas sanguinis]
MHTYMRSIEIIFVLNGSVRARDHIFIDNADALMRELEIELGLKNNTKSPRVAHISVRKRLLLAYKKCDSSLIGISVPIIYWLFHNHPDMASDMRVVIKQAAGCGCTMLADCVERRGRAYWTFSITADSLGV